MNDLKSLNVDELLSMLEETQDQNDSLLEQMEAVKKKNSEAQEEISRLSSENSLLQKTLRQKSGMIVSLNERIGTLQESDKVLEENLRLRKKNSELQEKNRRIKREAEAEVLAAKENYDTLADQFDNREQRIIKREKEIEYRIRAQDAEVARLSEEKIHDRMRQMESDHQKRRADLDRKYKRMQSRYAGIVFMAVAYGLLTTVITAIKTDVIVEDAISFADSIVKGLTGLYESAVKAGDFVSQIADHLPWELATDIMHLVLLVLTVAIVIGGVGFLAFFTVSSYIRFFREKQVDEITAWAVLMDMAVVVFLADEIRSIVSVNLILLFLLIIVVYSLIRAILQAENTQVRNAVIKYAVIVGGSIAGVALMVHFFGVIGIVAIPIGLLLAGENR